MPRNLVRQYVRTLNIAPHILTVTSSGDTTFDWYTGIAGSSLIVCVTTAGANVVVTLHPGIVGDTATISVQCLQLAESDVRLVVGATTYVVTNESQGITFRYGYNHLGTPAWLQEGQQHGPAARVARTICRYREYTRKLAAPVLGATDELQQGHAVAFPSGRHFAALNRKDTGSPAPCFCWHGGCADPVLSLISDINNAPNYIAGAWESDDHASLLIVGGTEDVKVGGHVLQGSAEVGGAGVASVSLAEEGGKLICAPARHGNNVVMATYMSASITSIHVSTDFGVNWVGLVHMSGSVSSVYINSTHVYISDGVTVLRSAIGGALSFSTVLTATAAITAINGGMFGGYLTTAPIVVCTTDGTLYDSTTGDAGSWSSRASVLHDVRYLAGNGAAWLGLGPDVSLTTKAHYKVCYAGQGNNHHASSYSAVTEIPVTRNAGTLSNRYQYSLDECRSPSLVRVAKLFANTQASEPWDPAVVADLSVTYRVFDIE